jgi:hypothetical protein
MNLENKSTEATQDGETKKVTKIEDFEDADNHAYDVLNTRFEVDKRYEIIDPIGSGAYGIVVAAKDAQ